MGDLLLIQAGEHPMGRLERRPDGLRLEYDERWRARRDAYPLSVSLPLQQRVHDGPGVRAWLQGLLPDNSATLERWGARFQVSPGSVFDLLWFVGQDCAGAVRFVPPTVTATRGGSVRWLAREEVGERLRDVRRDRGATRAEDDEGQFSLAGAQAKIALFSRDGRWGVPSGATPTTHILKPPVEGFAGYAENEHFCLALARRIGLAAASSSVDLFGSERAVVVTRYDRIDAPEGPIRIHQEDLCQAHGLGPDHKYQARGGPTPRSIAALLRKHSGRPREDVDRFVDALVFNWLILGTDGHAKNLGLLLAGGTVRLAPLYDLASFLPYAAGSQTPRSVKMAMKIGGEYRDRQIDGKRWRTLATELELEAEAVLARAEHLADAVLAAAPTLARDLQDAGLDDPVVAQLGRGLAARARRCRGRLRVG